jgi:hypothetical protein
MRGVNTLYTDIFDQATASKPKSGKGRNSHLHEARNEALVSRYFYYGNFFDRKFSYEFIIKKVASEFYLSPVTVPDIIEANYNMLVKLKKDQPGIKYFKDKWPHLVW